MNPRVKEALLWGVVGFLTFLVLLQGYELLEGLRVDLTVKAGAAVAVFLATTAITYVASGRVPAGTDETASTQRIDRQNEGPEEGTNDNESVEDGAAPGDSNDGNDGNDDADAFETGDEDDTGTVEEDDAWAVDRGDGDDVDTR